MKFSTIKFLLALTCDESARLSSEALDRDLSCVERWAVRLHAISCRSCRRFRRQVELFRNAMARYLKIHPDKITLDQTLSTEARERIARAILDRSS